MKTKAGAPRRRSRHPRRKLLYRTTMAESSQRSMASASIHGAGSVSAALRRNDLPPCVPSPHAVHPAKDHHRNSPSPVSGPRVLHGHRRFSPNAIRFRIPAPCCSSHHRATSVRATLSYTSNFLAAVDRSWSTHTCNTTLSVAAQRPLLPGGYHRQGNSRVRAIPGDRLPPCCTYCGRTTVTPSSARARRRSGRGSEEARCGVLARSVSQTCTGSSSITLILRAMRKSREVR
ncbi:hypothetical protein C8R46DRAFT_292409 [Mycena filopes]|nr:hypothetical protein C8R46DRAFT_292409 [Mycena filopes]